MFDIDLSGAGPTPAEMQLYCELGKLEHALNKLYPASEPSREPKFRALFGRVFFLAQLALEGDVTKDSYGKKQVGNRLAADVVEAEIRSIGEDLISDEAPRIKNGHLRELARWASMFSLVFLAGYVALMHFASSQDASVVAYLVRLHIDAVVAANFMLLWIGTLAGVCLSYAIRTHEFSVSDLIRTDDDHLAPQIRLVLTGLFATMLTLIAVLGLGDIAIGGFKLSNIDSSPLLAIVLGAIFGIGEQKLSNTVSRRVEDILGGAPKDSTHN